MIDLSVQRTVGAPRALRIFGIGGAGANVLDRMVLDGVNASHLVAINTDSQALQASVAGQKLQIGESVTRGLGAGGDPELGRAAAEEGFYVLRSALKDLDAVFLLGGLGGGTASGVLPAMAEIAKQEGALVIAFVTMPFGFEGKRRREQAQGALTRLKKHADAVICFENDLMGEQVSPRAGIAQAFAVADQLLSQSVRSVAALFYRKGLINLGFDDLKAALAGNQAHTLFAYGEAEGNNRPYDALSKALKSPLMDKGRLLRDCDTILIQVTGGPDMTLTEVELLMEEFNRKVEQRSRLLFGVAADTRSEGRMSVTIFATLAEIEKEESAPEVEAERAPGAEEALVIAVASRVEETISPEPVIILEEPAVSPSVEALPKEELEAPTRSDGLDAIFGPRATADAIVEEAPIEPPLDAITEFESPEISNPEPQESVTSLKVIIDEEAEDGGDDLEPLVPLADEQESSPAFLPSFVIEEEDGEEGEELESTGMAEPLLAFEEDEAVTDGAEEPVFQEEQREEVSADTPEQDEPEAPAAAPVEERQESFFKEQGGSIFSRPITRAVRPMPGRTLGQASPFFEEQQPAQTQEESLPTKVEIREEKTDQEFQEVEESAEPRQGFTEERIFVLADQDEQHSNGEIDAPLSPEASPGEHPAWEETSGKEELSQQSLTSENEHIVPNQDNMSEEETLIPPLAEESRSIFDEPEPTEVDSVLDREEELPARPERKEKRSYQDPLSAPPEPAPPTRQPQPSPSSKAPQQETLKFESTKRGRFEKSEPTIEDGQDLDVPTFLRRNIKIRP